MGTLHGRWKLVYTSNTRTLMLLNAIQSFPMVSVCHDGKQGGGRLILLNAI